MFTLLRSCDPRLFELNLGVMKGGKCALCVSLGGGGGSFEGTSVKRQGFTRNSSNKIESPLGSKRTSKQWRNVCTGTAPPYKIGGGVATKLIKFYDVSGVKKFAHFRG